jgi:hypothetical protein
LAVELAGLSHVIGWLKPFVNLGKILWSKVRLLAISQFEVVRAGMWSFHVVVLDGVNGVLSSKWQVLK